MNINLVPDFFFEYSVVTLKSKNSIEFLLAVNLSCNNDLEMPCSI